MVRWEATWLAPLAFTELRTNQGGPILIAEWLPALRSGLTLADGSLDDDQDFAIAFYGDIFRGPGKAALPAYDVEDVADPWECDLVAAWAEEALRLDDRAQSLSDQGKGRTLAFLQRALDALTHSRFFGNVGERALIGDLKQLRDCMNDETVRLQIQARLASCVGPDTRIVIGHSLGSVVAYEGLAAHPEWGVKMLVSLGSPLGIRNLIFDRLSPRPEDGVGAWPGSIEQWVNIADAGDIVALNKTLASLFGPKVTDHLIYNGATAHDISPYLTARETGQALRMGLGG